MTLSDERLDMDYTWGFIGYPEDTVKDFIKKIKEMFKEYKQDWGDDWRILNLERDILKEAGDKLCQT